MKQLLMALVALLSLLGCLSRSDDHSVSEVRPVTLDGSFLDWDEVEPLATDVGGEAPPGEVDFLALWVADDQEALYLRFELRNEILWQNPPDRVAGNDIRIYLDTDADSGTGSLIQGLGADYEIRLGAKVAFVHDRGGTQAHSLNEVRVRVAPSYSSSQFEVKIPFSVSLESADPRQIIHRPQLKLLLWDAAGNDCLPDQGTITYRVEEEEVETIEFVPLDRVDPADVRIISHNVHYNEPAGDPQPFQRYLKALRPDVVNFQEITAWTAEDTRDFVVGALEPGNESAWYAAQVDDCVTVSRWPILDTTAVDGNLLCRIDLPREVAAGALVLFNAHTPCCGHNDGRDYEHDHLAATWRDLLNQEGPFDIQPEDSVILAGDFNMVGFARQLYSLRDGDIYDNEVFGPDFRPDPIGSLVSAPLRHTHSREVYSWRDDGEVYPPGKLDYILFGPDRAKLKNNFTLYTPDIPETVLDRHGLRRGDSLASDHLVLVADFELR